MWQALKRILGSCDRSLLAAAGVSGAFFLYAGATFLLQGRLQLPGLLHLGAMTIVLFLLAFGIVRAMIHEVRREVEREAAEAVLVDHRMLLLFVATKAVVRTCLGVSLTLVWFAGVFYILETYRELGHLPALALAGIFSAVMLGLAFLLAFILDRLRFPAD